MRSRAPIARAASCKQPAFGVGVLALWIGAPAVPQQAAAALGVSLARLARVRKEAARQRSIELK